MYMWTFLVYSLDPQGPKRFWGESEGGASRAAGVPGAGAPWVAAGLALQERPIDTSLFV